MADTPLQLLDVSMVPDASTLWANPAGHLSAERRRQVEQAIRRLQNAQMTPVVDGWEQIRADEIVDAYRAYLALWRPPATNAGQCAKWRQQIQSYASATGNCARCDRPLSHPDSVRRGIGPDCWDQLTKERLHTKGPSVAGAA